MENQRKPKRRAEVQMRTLKENDKLGFLKAMQGEVTFYLENEAISIATRQGISPERILVMRWVLSCKRVENPEGEIVGRKPKARARLIIKGHQES